MPHDELEKALDYLRSTGLRITNQRSKILAYLINTKTHPTAEDIFQELKSSDENLSLATVYNTLDLFTKHKLVVSLSASDEKQHFDYFAHPHYHVICSNCGKIEDVFDFPLTSLKQHAQAATGFQITHSDIELYGLCPDCQKLTSQFNS